MRSRREESGSALIELVWLAVLLLVPMVYVVVTVFETQRTAYAASAAARSAGRAFVTSPDQGTAYARARAAARISFRDQGLSEPVRLVITCSPTPAACLSPGSVVSAHVFSSRRLPLAPALLGGGAPRIAVDAEHRAPYGTFREARP